MAAECVRRNRKIVEDRAKQVTHMARMVDLYHEVFNIIAGKNSKGAICRFIMLLVSLFLDTHVDGEGLGDDLAVSMPHFRQFIGLGH